ncbi:MAG TPA: VWA domain-containing protein, partial [Luteolibacter sp.]
MLTLSNPLGLFALLGIPAVLAIHFLQRKSVRLPVSTLFLLEKTHRESASGRRFDRLMQSVPLWMQLLAVLLLTWLLTEPRYQRPRSVQRVAIVLDSSASMSVFKDATLAALREKLPPLQGSASAIEFTVLESTPGRPRWFAGDSIDRLIDSLRDWNPRGGLTDPSQAIRLARSLVSREGTVVYVTDTPLESAPFEARQLSVGQPVENVGFTGVSFAKEGETLVWRALVRNYGKQPAERTWSLESPAGRSEPKPLHLEPGGMVSLQAAFPAGTDRARVALSSDAFALDDLLPLVRPQPKPLALFAPVSDAFDDLTKRLLRSLDATTPVHDAASADLSLVRYDPLDPALPPENAVVFVHDSTQGGAYLKGGILTEKHPLLDGLNWQSLLVRETIPLERTKADRVLLWQGERALIFLREISAAPDRPAAQQLCFNFDLRLSNASTQPAFIVLLHRFAESIRTQKVAFSSELLETSQPVALAFKPGTEKTPVNPLESVTTDADGKAIATQSIRPGEPLHAPAEPGFFTVKQGDHPLLLAAVHFGDSREADFSNCQPADTLDGAS